MNTVPMRSSSIVLHGEGCVHISMELPRYESGRTVRVVLAMLALVLVVLSLSVAWLAPFAGFADESTGMIAVSLLQPAAAHATALYL